MHQEINSQTSAGFMHVYFGQSKAQCARIISIFHLNLMVMFINLR